MHIEVERLTLLLLHFSNKMITFEDKSETLSEY
jgi:hypothetical protein